MALLGVTLIACPSLIDALPDRYAHYLPEPLEALRLNSGSGILPPTLVSTSSLVPTHTSTPTPIRASTSASSHTPTYPIPTSTTPPTFTPSPTSTPTREPTSTPDATPTSTPLTNVTLTGLRHERQGWNNCGPTTLAMALSYWGYEETQYDIAPILKPDSQDKHVGSREMEAYARSLGLGAVVRVGGTLDRLKALVQAGFPVIVETWYVRDAYDQLGHYRLIIGYDELAQEFDVYDSLYDPPTTIGYRELDELWRVFNRLYIVVYTLDRWESLALILGSDLSDLTMHERALETARAEAENPPQSCVAYADCADWVTFSWFNVGSSLTSLRRHAEAAAAYDQARQMGIHRRMLWYQFGPYESYYAVGRYDDVIALASATLATADNLEESYYWRGMARLAQGDSDGARADFEAALRHHENWVPAASAAAELQDSP
jgi:tetratricopeptide (TPR) repeat protein